MGNRKDYTGQKFGMLTFIARNKKKNKRGETQWKLQCDCGNIIHRTSDRVISGRIKSCGCLKHSKRELTGQKFGMITFVEPTKKRSGRSVVWKVQCDCGAIVFRPSSKITNGEHKSCGCLNRTDYTGKKFAMLTFIEPTNKKRRRGDGHIIWRIQCDCGNIVFLPPNNIVRGQKSCGCLIKAKRNHTGQKLGMITFIEPTAKRIGSQVVWKARCDCGSVFFQSATNIKRKRIKSCGCKMGREIHKAQKIAKRRAVPGFVEGQKLRKNVSEHIRRALRNNQSSKNGSSCLKFLSYTIPELCAHLESLFEPWMNWKNRGQYRSKSWRDNDPSTWKWQLDHIIPQSWLPYSSMDDDNFKKCWSLENLRPYSAKQNTIDNNRRGSITF